MSHIKTSVPRPRSFIPGVADGSGLPLFHPARPESPAFFWRIADQTFYFPGHLRKILAMPGWAGERAAQKRGGNPQNPQKSQAGVPKREFRHVAVQAVPIFPHFPIFPVQVATMRCANSTLHETARIHPSSRLRVLTRHRGLRRSSASRALQGRPGSSGPWWRVRDRACGGSLARGVQAA